MPIRKVPNPNPDLFFLIHKNSKLQNDILTIEINFSDKYLSHLAVKLAT